MQRKVNMESERLRVRLRQELAELQGRLSPSPASARERLAPLAQELQRSLSSNTQDLCGQLSVYLQSLERPPAPIYREAFERMSQTLERSSAKAAQVISDFQAKSVEELQHLKGISGGEKEGAEAEPWQEMSSRLEQEVNSLKAEARDRVGALRAKLAAAALQTERPQKAELTANAEQFCQSSTLQDQAVQARLEGLFQDSSSPSLSSSGGTLTDDFTVQLSALIHDIRHSV